MLARGDTLDDVDWQSSFPRHTRRSALSAPSLPLTAGTAGRCSATDRCYLENAAGERSPQGRFQCPLQLLEAIRIIARTSCACPATTLPELREPLEKRAIAGRLLTRAFRSDSFEQSQTDEAFRFLAKACLINAKETWRTVVMLQRLSLEQTRPIWGKNGWPVH
jgi:hypothetical protein